MNILIVCGGGISTNIMAQSVASFASDDENIKAISVDKLNILIDDTDLVLVAPQIEYLYEEVKEYCKQHDTLCTLIDFETYGTMDGKKTLIKAREMLQGWVPKEYRKKGTAFRVIVSCAGGISSRMLGMKLEDVAFEKGYNLNCDAYSPSRLIEGINNADLVLLGPQVAFSANSIKTSYPDKTVLVIDKKDYASLDAENIFRQIEGHLKKD